MITNVIAIEGCLEREEKNKNNKVNNFSFAKYYFFNYIVFKSIRANLYFSWLFDL